MRTRALSAAEGDTHSLTRESPRAWSGSGCFDLCLRWSAKQRLEGLIIQKQRPTEQEKGDGAEQQTPSVLLMSLVCSTR